MFHYMHNIFVVCLPFYGAINWLNVTRSNILHHLHVNCAINVISDMDFTLVLVKNTTSVVFKCHNVLAIVQKAETAINLVLFLL